MRQILLSFMTTRIIRLASEFALLRRISAARLTKVHAHTRNEKEMTPVGGTAGVSLVGHMGWGRLRPTWKKRIDAIFAIGPKTHQRILLKYREGEHVSQMTNAVIHTTKNQMQFFEVGTTFD